MKDLPKEKFVKCIADVLPNDWPCELYHLSTAPSRSESIFAPPSEADSDPTTFCEKHFFAVTGYLSQASGRSHNAEILLFALEINIYTTRELTTIFVSKADSTGYLKASGYPEEYATPLRSMTACFIAFLAENRCRPGIPMVLSLFARAQHAYLFPGSDENVGKHGLNDRQLIKWWSRVLNDILHRASRNEVNAYTQLSERSRQAFLRVPGMSQQEVLSLTRNSSEMTGSLGVQWQHGDPLTTLPQMPEDSPRSLVPRFPDDPKCRFADELDDEVAADTDRGQLASSPTKPQARRWRSVKTLDQFWEFMAFRQECSSGKLVGFEWLVFRDNVDASQITASKDSTAASIATKVKKSTENKETKPRLQGVIIPRRPRIQSEKHHSKAQKTPYYHWSVDAGGTIVVNSKSYDRVHDLLLRLDFADRSIATASTKRWIEESATIGGVARDWGVKIRGTNSDLPKHKVVESAPTAIQTISLGTKKIPKSNGTGSGGDAAISQSEDTVRALEEVTRKRQHSDAVASQPSNTGIQTISASVVRKKPKVLPTAVP